MKVTSQMRSAGRPRVDVSRHLHPGAWWGRSRVELLNEGVEASLPLPHVGRGGVVASFFGASWRLS